MIERSAHGRLSLQYTAPKAKYRCRLPARFDRNDAATLHKPWLRAMKTCAYCGYDPRGEELESLAFYAADPVRFEAACDRLAARARASAVEGTPLELAIERGAVLGDPNG